MKARCERSGARIARRSIWNMTSPARIAADIGLDPDAVAKTISELTAAEAAAAIDRARRRWPSSGVLLPSPADAGSPQFGALLAGDLVAVGVGIVASLLEVTPAREPGEGPHAQRGDRRGIASRGSGRHATFNSRHSSKEAATRARWGYLWARIHSRASTHSARSCPNEFGPHKRVGAAADASHLNS